jgi:uncharacterized RDD family membrane protein YckC
VTAEKASPPSPATPPLPLAGLRRRWAALVYEGLLLAALLLIAGFAVLPLLDPGGRASSYSAEQLYVLPPASRAFLLFYYVAVTGAYCVGFWSGGRRTLPMKTWGLALVRPDGVAIDVRLATQRFAAGWIGPAAGLAGYAALGRWGFALGLVNHAWGWVDPDRQFLHDRIAGTRIVRA